MEIVLSLKLLYKNITTFFVAVVHETRKKGRREKKERVKALKWG